MYRSTVGTETPFLVHTAMRAQITPTSPRPGPQSQLTLDSFLTKRERFAKIRSKRLQQVGLTGIHCGSRQLCKSVRASASISSKSIP